MTHYWGGNLLLHLAQPLFRILDELSPELKSMARMEWLKRESRKQLVHLRRAGNAVNLPVDAVEAVHYCFCTALDQAGSRVQGGASGSCRGVWLQDSLLREYYGSADTGQQCRTWILRLREAPDMGTHALAVIAALVARGLRDEHGAPLPDTAPRVRPALVPAEAEETMPASVANPERRRRTMPWRGIAVVLVALALSLSLAYFIVGLFVVG
jgi:type VI secretion system protein ImpK